MVIGELKIVNILIKDNENNLYRIFKISHGKDRHGENYFKVIIPDLIGKTINTHKTPKYIKPPDLKGFPNSLININTEIFHEYTYHYEGGAAHFKNNKGNRLHQIKNLPKLQEIKFLNFIRFVIHDLSKFKTYKKMITENDLVLELPFNNLGRLLNLYLLENVNINLINDDERVCLIGSYKINVQGTKKYVILQEFCYIQPQLIENKISFSLFVFNNTTANLVPN